MTCPPGLHGQVVLRSDALRRGLVTPAALLGPSVRRLLTGVYTCSCVEVTHRRRIEAAALLLPAAVFTGRSSAVLWGVPLAGPDDVVELNLPPHSRAGAGTGLRVTRVRLAEDEVETWNGLRHTTPLRTALDLARTRPVEDAAVVLDRFLRRGLVPVEQCRRAAATLTGRDCRHVRAALDLADGLAESPPETRLRLLLRAAGLPAPVAQFVVVGADGRKLARVDFAWPDHRLVLEYDGGWHGAPQQVGPDRQRLNRLTAAGWRVVFATAADLHRPQALLERLARELSAPRHA